MDKQLDDIKQKVARIRADGKHEATNMSSENIWLKGEYTEYNRENN